LILSPLAAPAQNLFVRTEPGIPGIPLQYGLIYMEDMDQDGDQDMASGKICDDGVLLFINREGKLDSVPLVVPIPAEERFHITDWNQDGRPDILGERGGKAYLVFNEGGLAFSEARELLSITSELEVEDLNGDGYPDLYQIGYTNNTIQICLNQGGAPAVELLERQLPYLPGGSVFADFTGDGLPELLALSVQNDSPGRIFIYRQDSGAQFTMVDSVEVPGLPPYAGGYFASSNIFTVDLDNDGIEEILLKRKYRIQLFKWEGGFDFSYTYVGNSDTPSHEIGALGHSPAIQAADIDGNGFPDLYTDNTIFYNDQLSFSAREVYPYNHYRIWNRLADTDGDGRLEIWGQDGGQLVNGLQGMTRSDYLGNQAFSARQLVWPVHSWGWGEAASALFDSNNDQQIDLAFFASGLYVVLSYSDNGQYREKVIVQNGNYDEMSTMDLDADGLEDLLLHSSLGTGFGGWKNLGDGNFQAVAGIPNIGKIITARDLNNDGREDVIGIQNPNAYNAAMKYFVNTEGGFVLHSSYPLDNGNYRFYDYNGDGFDDFALSMGGRLRVFRNNGGEGFEEVRQWPVGEYDLAVGWADMNLDGKKDLLYEIDGDDSNSINYRPYTGSDTFGEPVYLLPPPYSLSTERFLWDINNDGLEDFLTGAAVAFNQGTSFSAYEHQYAFPTSRPKIYDYDQDGDQDLLFATAHCGVQVMENTTVSAFKILGAAFFDENGNGAWDAGELPAQQTKVGIESLDAYAYTDTAGRFQILLGGQQGELKVTAFHPFGDYFTFTTVPYPAEAGISDDHPVDTVLIGLQPINPLAGTLDQTIRGHRCGGKGRLWINYNSITPHITQGELTLNFPEGVAYSGESSMAGPEQSGNSLSWALDSLLPMSPGRLWAHFQMPGFQSEGDTLVFIASLKTWRGSDTLVLQDTLSAILTCAIDPNDKQIANGESFVQGNHLFTAQDRVEYLARFQNTGTDTAFQVRILDNLPPHFDLGSLDILSASHPFKASLSPYGLLAVEFPDIELPDSAADLQGSMGFVKFALRLKPDAARDQDILNGARIYFDQNPPVYTNVAGFRRIECSHFTQVENSSNIRCANSTYTNAVPTFGVPQVYAWHFDDELISESDTAWYAILAEGLHHLSLAVSNRICTADTTMALNIIGTAPDLGLNISMDTTICENYPPIQLTANQSCYWYVNGALHHLSSSHQVNTSQSIRVRNQFGSCQTTVEFDVTAVPIAPQPLIAEGTALVFACVGDTLVFHSLVGGNFHWAYYDFREEMDQTVQSSPLILPWEVLGEPGDINTLRLYYDTLNCTLIEQAPIFPQAGQLELAARLEGDTAWCGQPVPLSWFANVNQESLEQLSLWREGEWIAYLDPWMGIIQLPQPGLYSLTAVDACASVDTAEAYLHDFGALIPEILISGDTLSTSTGASVRWYYRSGPASGFWFVSEAPRAIAPGSGSFFFRFSSGSCSAISDTIQLQVNQLAGQEDRSQWQVSFNTVTRVLAAGGALPPGGVRYRLFDALGRAVEEGRLQPSRQFGQLPGGWYVALVEGGGKVVPVRMFLAR